MPINIPLPQLADRGLYALLAEILRRSVDGTINAGFGNLTPKTSVDSVGAFSARRTAVTAANGANSDLAIGAAGYVGLVGPTGAFSVTGFANGSDGRILTITSEVAQAMTITNLATSGAANQIITGTGANVVAGAVQGVSMTFIYNGTLAKWCLVRST